MRGTMENYFGLAEQYTTQSEPEYCGPASLTMILNALNIDPNRQWKGYGSSLCFNLCLYSIWRWFTEEILHCTTSEAMKRGMTLEQITQLARCNGLHTMTFRPNYSFSYLKGDELTHSHDIHTHDSESCCNLSHHQ